MAAGCGTRLGSLTKKQPKCLMTINGKPLLGYWLDILKSIGVDPVLVNTHHLAAQVHSFVHSRHDADRIQLVFERELLGTGGTLRANAEFINGESILIIHADNLCLSNIPAFIDAHYKRSEKVQITMMTFCAPDPTQCGVVELDENSIVTGFYEKVEEPPSDIANAAVYIFEPTVIQDICSYNKKYLDISIDVLPKYVGRIQAWPTDGFHIDIGTPQNLEKANAFMASSY